MRAVIQRVSHAQVAVAGKVTGRINRGVLVLLGVGREDEQVHATTLAGKITKLRVFEDEDGKMNRSLAQVGGAVLAVSQFTLLADTRKGNRPSFADAAPPEMAEPLYEAFCSELERSGFPVARGVFGAHMDVSLTNDGPVTILLEA